MRVPAAVAPLVTGATYRRGVYLLLGGVIALPYVLLAAIFVRMFADGGAPLPALTVLVAAAMVIGAVPAFLGATRALEITAARALLGADLPDPAGRRIDRETRLRSALWFASHAVVGGLVALALLIALPMALMFVTQQIGVGDEALAGLRIGPIDEHDTGWLTALGAALLIGVVYLVAGLGALAAMLAPALLGPSQTERIAALEAQAARLAERNRLARELHDSVGHALTVTTLQASAARELLVRDPEFARRALESIEEAGRGAMQDLDYVLGVLRDRESPTPGHGPREPHRTLADVDRLVADTRVTGVPVTLDVAGAVRSLPASVSREGYRIVQEGLTNAARHSGRHSVTVRIACTDSVLTIDMTNPLTGATAGVDRGADGTGGRRDPRSGQGLAGIRERVALLGGRMTAGQVDGTWRLTVELPITGNART